jgi:hypothetical protein
VGRFPHEDPLGVSAPGDVVTITARHRLPGDVSSELVAVLASDPHIVVCDLTGMAAGTSAAHVFEPVTAYLSHWPGTVVVGLLPSAAARADVVAAETTGRLLLRTDRKAALVEARSLVRETDTLTQQLMPLPTAPREARTFAARALLDWRHPRLVPTASLVVSEIVTESLMHAQTVIDLALTLADSRVRVAVHDRGGGRPEPQEDGWDDETPSGHAMLLVDRLAFRWGVFPARNRGKTVWALLDAS